MVKLKEELWTTLLELKDAEFKHFKWFLKHDDILEDFSGIPEAFLEKAERCYTVDLMVQKYQGPGALKVTLKVLEKIYRNDLVQRLERLQDLNNHDSVPLKSDHERKKAELGDKIKLMIQERQMKIREIKHSTELSNKSADKHVADSERVFAVLLQSVKRSLTYLIKAINEKRKTAQKQADDFIRELEQEISDLTKTSNKMEQLSRTENHLNVPFASLPLTKNWTEVSVPPPSYGGSVGTAVNQLQEEFSKEKEKLIAKAKLHRVQQFAKDVTLDPDTANPNLILSEDGKQVYCGDVKQNLPDNPERFNCAANVLGKQSFSSGRFYYEVQVEGKTSWDLGVVKESIDRKLSVTANPTNGYWTICLRDADKYRTAAVHLSVKYPPKKVGVFVDYEKGLVSFFDVDSADLIHSFTDCSFTEKLYPFFSPGLHYEGKNSTPLIVSPVNYTD
ncbi:E3 ubiquitin-protein ligase TRIM39-like [Micropterus salmoides]|uniref:E3 ubiquitin-protein ligase TRIM39-like n=1 Tax=Micropterus salmoides TaxID=27706 RepID=UPI0018EDC410|nr:E3 ubiquitin-protein ligase TRIM39-like [Micropterus salmoides]XP_038563967.1 E3 ubiquitin-protein ligase TRIM39-like [Micropterus salmoides]XP_038563968.1 E3 ubiquitin-protein ligase TRIM39-like [Micropterus salmoides]XP_038563969.1 E3 ubiquitin-protein ligase TRIM39-like [Micropterus salmoides]XP_038563970.1 E3 ubiquitin-protein ligase TRIM39-like [Micropterus salmoides]